MYKIQYYVLHIILGGSNVIGHTVMAEISSARSNTSPNVSESKIGVYSPTVSVEYL